jgi:hypothetical protein
MKTRLLLISAVILPFLLLGISKLVRPTAALAQEAAVATAVAATEVPSPVLPDYSGPGEVFVLGDGRIVVLMPETQPDALGFYVESAGELYLSHAGQDFYLSSDNASTAREQTRASTVALRMPLATTEGYASRAVLHIAGHVTLAEDTTEAYSLIASDTAGQTFATSFKLGGGAAATAQGSSCTVDCDQNGIADCTCSGFAVCWCFCGLFHEPHCIGLFPVAVFKIAL